MRHRNRLALIRGLFLLLWTTIPQRGRADDFPLRVDGTNDKGTLSWQSQQPDLERRLRVHAVPPADLAKVCVAIESLLNEQGIAVPMEEPTAPVCGPLALGHWFEVRLRAKLSEPGKYSTKILLTSGSQHSQIPLAVQRTQARLPTLETLNAIRVQLSVFDDATVRVPLLVTDEGELTDESPALVVSLARRGPGGAMHDVSVEIGAPSNPDVPRIPKHIDLSHVPGPGEYQGKLWLRYRANQKVAHTFAIQAKAPWWLAFLCILSGAGLAALLRWLVHKVRPQLANERRLAAIKATLATASWTAGRLSPLAEQLAAEIEAAQLELRAGNGSDVTVHTIEEKCRRLRQLQSARVRLERAGGKRFWPQGDVLLSTAEAALRSSSTDPDALKQAARNLEDFNRLLPDAMREPLTKLQQELEASLDKLTEVQDTKTVERRAELQKLLANAKQLLTTAAMDAAYQELARAGLQVASLVSTDIARRAKLPAERPEATQWRDLHTRADALAQQLALAESHQRSALTAEEAQEYDRIQKAYQTLSSGDVMGPNNPAEVAPQSDGGALALVATYGALPDTSAQPSVSALDRQRAVTDIIINLMALVISCASGLLALWVDDPVWGDVKSLIIAGLWGLGLHQIAGVALGSISDVQNKLLGAK